MPKVSIIVPCYNQARFLPDALDSLLVQTWTNWECIVVNDGSRDDTTDVATLYSQRDSRVRLIAQKNRGLSGARNRGLKEAKGEWIQLLDADDILLPGKLQKQLEVLTKCRAPSLSFCDYYFSDAQDLSKRVTKGHDYEHPRLQHDDPLMDLVSRWETDLSIPAHSFLFDARLFTEGDISFDEKLPNHEDWDCWMQVFGQQPIIVPLHQELVVYRQHPNSMATDKTAMWVGYEKAIKKQMCLFRDNPLIRHELRKKLALMHSVYFGKKKNVEMRWLAVVIALYRRTMPWPIQVRLHKMAARRSK